jgi:hypothetical protein
MIPYEELVVALATWRQKQGLAAGPATGVAARRTGAQAAPPPAFQQVTTQEIVEDSTSVSVAPAAPRKDETGEIDLDGLDVVEEEPA